MRTASGLTFPPSLSSTLKERIVERYGSMRKFAIRHQMSPAALSLMIAGKQSVSPSSLKTLASGAGMAEREILSACGLDVGHQDDSSMPLKLPKHLREKLNARALEAGVSASDLVRVWVADRLR